MEELWWNDKGELERTRRPPTRSRPRTTCRTTFRIDFWREPNREETIYRIEGGRRAAVHAGAVGVPCAARRDRERGRAHRLCAAARCAGDRRAHPAPRSTDVQHGARGPHGHDRACRWHELACARRARRRRAVLVTVAHATGSTPREAGAAMVVDLHDAFGTIGGGHLEFEAIRLARDALAHDARARASGSCAFRSPRGSANAAAAWRRSRSRRSIADALPGSTSRWPARAPARPCAIVSRIGAGSDRKAQHGRDGRRCRAARSATPHSIPRRSRGARRASRRTRTIARWWHRRPATGRRCSSIPSCPMRLPRAACSATATSAARSCRCSVRCRRTCAGSTRATHDFPAHVPAQRRGRRDRRCRRPKLAAAPHGAYVVVMTHSHALDFDSSSAALARDDWRYLGLIGSTSKRAQFERRLLARGSTPERSRASPARSAPAGLPPQQGAGRDRGRGRGGAARVARASRPSTIARRQAARVDAPCAGDRPTQWRLTRRRDTAPRARPASPRSIRRVVANDGIDLDVAARRDPRGARRERRRQVDADEDHLRRRSSRTPARSSWEGKPVDDRQPGACAQARHRHGVPALLAVRDADRRREHRARARRRARRARACPQRIRDVSAQATACRSIRAPRAHDVGRRAAARRDRPLPAAGPAPADHGRADVGADAAGGREAVRDAAPLAAEGCSILYISHKLDEIRALCHTATVLRGGQGDRHVRSAAGDVVVARAHDDRRRPAAPVASRRARRARTRCVVDAISRLPADDPFGTVARATSTSPCAPARSSASRASRATARRSCWPRCPASGCCRRRRRSRILRRAGGPLDAGAAARARLRASCRRSGSAAAPCRRCRSPTTRCSPRTARAW